MGIAHGNEGKKQAEIAGMYRIIDDGLAVQADRRVQVNRYIRRSKPRFAHADPGGVYFGAVVPGNDRAHAGHCVDGHLAGRPRDDAALDGVLGETPDAVAAHFSLGTIGIEHPHPQVGNV